MATAASMRQKEEATSTLSTFPLRQGPRGTDWVTSRPRQAERGVGRSDVIDRYRSQRTSPMEDLH